MPVQKEWKPGDNLSIKNLYTPILYFFKKQQQYDINNNNLKQEQNVKNKQLYWIDLSKKQQQGCTHLDQMTI